jgi:hypothetical protein
VLYGAITGRDPRESTWAPFPIDARLGAQIRSVASATLSASPEWPASDLVPAALAASVAANSGAATEAKPARGSAISAKNNRAAKRRESGRSGHVAASIADLLGRAPGQSDAPILGPGSSAASSRSAGSRSSNTASAPATPGKPQVYELPLGPDHAADAPVRIF